MTTKFDIEDITALDVLGMMARKSRDSSIPPCLLCMSDKARAEIRALGSEFVDKYREAESNMKKLREAGNALAFFIE